MQTAIYRQIFSNATYVNDNNCIHGLGEDYIVVVTLLYGGLLALWYVVLSVRVSIGKL